MPITVDLYETRTMLRVVEELKRPKRFLTDLFFQQMEQSDTKHVDIDIISGRRTLAPFVSPLAQGHVIDKQGYTTKTFAPPYIKLKRSITLGDLQARRPGETIYGGTTTPESRQAELLGRHLGDMRDQVTRRIEWMSAKVLQSGKITVTGEGVSAEIDFGMPAGHKVTLTGDDLWSADTANPLADLRTWARKIAQDSGLSARVAVMGTSAYEAFIAHPDVRDQLDSRRIEMGVIDPSQLPNGATYVGFIKDPGIDLYRYDEWYYDEDEATEKPMVEAAKVVMGAVGPEVRAAQHFGAIEDIDALANYAVPFYPKSWTDHDPGVRWVMLQSAPLVCPHQINAFLYATVVS